MSTSSVPPSEYAVRWTNGVAHVPVVCAGCGRTVPVVGVTTVAGALAALAAQGQHQH